LGHRETHPLITQEALSASHTEKLKLSFLLFDEIEKASDALWQLLLGMLDKARSRWATTGAWTSPRRHFPDVEPRRGRNYRTHGRRHGFVQPKEQTAAGLDEKVERTAVKQPAASFAGIHE